MTVATKSQKELAPNRLSARRLYALVGKESLQALRDPSTLLIAFVLPVILLFLFAYAVSLDVDKINIGIVQQSDSKAAHDLQAGLAATQYLQTTVFTDERTAAKQLLAGQLRGYVVITQDFEQRLAQQVAQPLIQIITDGAQPNTANCVANYVQGVLSVWQNDYQQLPNMPLAAHSIELQPRYWFNAELASRKALLPGAIAIIMTMIGTLLTALVVAREWERGSMEAIMSTPASVVEILMGKLLPYFFLGLLSTLVATALATYFFAVPLQGSLGALLLLAAVFMIPALGQGLLISSVTKNQFLAAQIALFSGFLPAFMLSGFLYEIESMPWAIQLITWIVPARYFVSSLKTVFLVGDVWSVFTTDLIAMALLGLLFFALARRFTQKDLAG